MEKAADKKPNKDTARSQPSANQGEASEESNPTHTQPPKLSENDFLFLTPLNRWCFLLEAQVTMIPPFKF